MDVRAGRALYESEERYESVVSAMTEGVILQDADSTILACNPAAHDLLGLSADQLMGRTSLDPRWRSIHEDGSPFPGETHPVPVTLRTGRAQRNVVMGVHKPDGTLTWISINSDPLFREGETAAYAAVCTFSDITRRKLAEDELRRSEERYRRIVETTLEGVWMIDLDGNTTFANGRMAEMLGCSLAELLSSSVWSYIEQSDQELAKQRIEARARGINEVHDFRFRRKDGKLLWASMATSAITFADGAKGALAMVRDVTERHQMEAELLESKERLELALAVGQMGAWEWSLDTSATHGSAQLLEILGLPPGSSLSGNDKFLRHVHPEDLVELETRMNCYIASGSTERFVNNFRIVRPDGSVRWVSSAGRLMVTVSGERRIVGTMIDLTESRALEEQLQQAQRLESIGRLAGGVAHDFNNLLTAILASAQFAERSAPASVVEELRTIATAAERGAELTRQLLAFARKQVIELVSVDLNAVISNLASVLRRLVGEDIVISHELDDKLWKVRAGVSQLEQVIVNLVVNARDAMPDGGTLRIRTQCTELGSPNDHMGAPRGEYVTLVMSDTGVGIEPSVLPHIFEPFYSTKRAGTGLGLASTYGIMKQLGGQIRVDSSPGNGTTFTIFLPRDQGGSGTRQVSRAPLANRTDATILFVEDEELLRGVVARSLGQSGYHVLVASNGPDALALVAAHPGPIDLLVTDVVMPGMSGRQLAEALLRLRPELKVLFVSGYTDQIIARHGVLEPGQNFLPKPYAIEILEQRISELLASNHTH